MKVEYLGFHSLSIMPQVLKIIFCLSAVVAVVFVLISLTPFFEISASGLKLNSYYWWSGGPGWIAAFSAFISSLAFGCAILRIKVAKILLIFSWSVSGVLLPTFLYAASRNLLLLIGFTSVNSMAVIALAIYLYKAKTVKAYFK